MASCRHVERPRVGSAAGLITPPGRSGTAQRRPVPNPQRLRLGHGSPSDNSLTRLGTRKFVSIASTVILMASTMTACGGGTDGPIPEPGGASRTADSEAVAGEVETVTLPPAEPTQPPTGKLYADMRQSSIDASLGQAQVWIRNDTAGDLDPQKIRFVDSRFPAPVLAGNLRVNPTRSERGFPIALPRVPNCSAAVVDPRTDARTGTVEVITDAKTWRVQVFDEADVVARFIAGRCNELRLAKVVSLSWSESVRTDGGTSPVTGELTLIAKPSRTSDRSLVIDSVEGSHLFQSTSEPPVWNPARTIDLDAGTTRLPLPLKPARCDDHAFAEGGGATAFRVHFTLDNKPGDILLRMSPTGASNAFAFAREACGLD